MEILFLYISSERQIFANQNINFGGEFRFQYLAERQQLSIERNPMYIQSFFQLGNLDNSANIENVTSIIGGNGAGKTSLLRFIKNTFASGSGGVQNPIVLALKSEKGIIVYYSEELPISNHNCEEFAIKLQELTSPKNIVLKNDKTPAFEYKMSPKVKEFDYADIVFFSNVLNDYGDIEVKGTRDISTSFLIKHDFESSVQNRLANVESANLLETHFSQEISRQIAFINRYNQNKFLPFRLPQLLFISSKRDLKYDFRYSSYEKEIFEEYGFSEQIVLLTDRLLKNINAVKNNLVRLTNHFIADCILNFLFELATNFRSISSKLKFKLPAVAIKSKESNLLIATEILNNIRNQAKKFHIKLDEKHDNWINNTEHFINLISKAIASKQDLISDLNQFAIDISDSKGEFKEFYNSYRDSFLLKPYLNFKWHNISSGETALLNFYSRFYSISNDESINELQKNVIILIDEGDIYFHPAWQKKFVYLLLEYLPTVFSKTRSGERRNIQIIFNTNSPIQASDLPNDNTIFLEKIDSFTTVVRDSLNDQKETFAANIYTLFSDSFFIKEGVIGDFAMIKIDQIIIELTKGAKPDKHKREIIRKVIHQIGEPILKHKLMQMYNDRFNLEIHERLDKIESKLGI